MKIFTHSNILVMLPTAASAFLPISPRALHTTSALKMAADEFSFRDKSAAEVFSGGPVTEDLNLYNLDLEKASSEWTATKVVNSGTKPDGVYLEPRSNALVYDEKLTFPITRQVGQGLGIELLELAGGRDDGVGITIVSGLVEGSVSENSGLVPGDSIIKMAVVTGELEDELAEINTECCNWDKTVELIGSLPPASSADDTERLLVTVKRLRRKPIVSVTVEQEDDTTKKLQLFAGTNLRQGMLFGGVKLDDKFAKSFADGGTGDCGSDGGCGLCTVAVMEGADLLNEPDDSERDVVKGDNRRLSCRTIVGYGMKEGTLKVKLNPGK
eukprot:CAMPEP_0197436006 /NCGR_PEP_ID=MMETSP1175-20131217/3485_1 /TAXON_ID=1003142 /ORGANISM="Triceratium dubium, Strain CCMP147" /LENGTH=326 /DNA_ID=CAMNT_0042965175 /DNA_START=96 /DNA_END=1076 /DNA_ORIENTATION=-